MGSTPVKNHGIPEANISDCLHAARAFFDLPLPEKIKVCNEFGSFRGLNIDDNTSSISTKAQISKDTQLSLERELTLMMRYSYM